MPKLQDEAALTALRERIQGEREQYVSTVTMCAGTACRACGCLPVAEAMAAEIAKQKLEEKVRFYTTGCHGFCEQGPLAVIEPGNIFYCHIKAEDVPEIVEQTLKNGAVIERLLYTDPVSGGKVNHEKEIPFYAGQERALLGMNPKLYPTSVEAYIALGGYAALAKVLSTMTAEDVIAEVKASGIRGRGGGGFPTGRKWELCRAAKGQEHYVVCNADEGDPGAYMDRSVLEGNPHAIIEGMAIGAYAIGSRQGFVYVRNEYGLAVRHLRQALEEAHERGLLGANILGSCFDFDVAAFTGAGAFVCGEETGLIASLEGRTGTPRPRPPYPAVAGLWGQPTNVNNVETWANIPAIISRGGESFAKVGTEGSKGTKIFSLVGKINNTGLVEVPMGMTLREIVFGLGGGIPDGKKFKAVQTGGPSGGCIPETLLDIPVDFDKLTEAGSMMGSGGMVVMDETTCMADVARYFVEFLSEESCGKCTPCREGLRLLCRIFERVCGGEGTAEDLAQMEELGWVMKNGSLCGLGQTAANPVLSVLRHFREEVEAHVYDKRCPAGVCRGLIRYWVVTDACEQCGVCLKICPNEAIAEKDEYPVIDDNLCNRCGVCEEGCPHDAIKHA